MVLGTPVVNVVVGTAVVVDSSAVVCVTVVVGITSVVSWPLPVVVVSGT